MKLYVFVPYGYEDQISITPMTFSVIAESEEAAEKLVDEYARRCNREDAEKHPSGPPGAYYWWCSSFNEMYAAHEYELVPGRVMERTR